MSTDTLKSTANITVQASLNVANTAAGTVDAITATFLPTFTVLVDKMRATIRKFTDAGLAVFHLIHRRAIKSPAHLVGKYVAIVRPTVRHAPAS